MPVPIDLEEFWMRMLSGDSALIDLAWKSLSAEEQSAVRDHLHVMAQEKGWHPSQRSAARSALQRIEKGTDPDTTPKPS